ncbi:squalene-associated FAD-dependent desaturase [Inhella inkyongensis]|uniref:Squalene-associated FAD-dependent desaturase n=1 Tax=Inhella inkyongensis TaxID=392593 RepID=A0A840SA13_9BURK|nr:hydroxysqualene dehydroxylase HpnE [Inhella inkyongensis]MBB5205846.1 squalene-associated FAD-dependent desaturase [Inhella inkyongensis]
MKPQLCVIGGGWAGLAAAVEGVRLGAQVRLLEMAPQLGGRARSLSAAQDGLDSGHHILIGAYSATLNLMRTVGADPDTLLWRGPLALVDGQGVGLRWPAGAAALPALMQAALRHPRWQLRDKLALGRWGLGLALRGLRCPDNWTVKQLCASLPLTVRTELFDPLCIAALNTPIETASASVFLRVLRDALLGGRGAADLLLPRRPLSQLLPSPAEAWLATHGAEVRLSHRVQSLQHAEGIWLVDGEPAQAVVIACSATEAARLCNDLNPAWAETARALQPEAIATVYLDAPGVKLAAPMVALKGSPAQFIFDLGAIGGRAGRFAAVGSAVAAALGHGRASLIKGVRAQIASQLPDLALATVVSSHADRRATFACSAGLIRPNPQIAAGVFAAGDYVDGPYPATLEGAVRSGLIAAQSTIAG